MIPTDLTGWIMYAVMLAAGFFMARRGISNPLPQPALPWQPAPPPTPAPTPLNIEQLVAAAVDRRVSVQAAPAIAAAEGETQLVSDLVKLCHKLSDRQHRAESLDP